MNINTVQNFSFNNSLNSNRIKNIQSNGIAFTAHADFNKLKDIYDVTASTYFRRGTFYGGPSAEFGDIVNVFKQLFTEKPNEKKTMLISGIADSQESFSYLAVIKDLIKDKKLADVLDLKINDLQSRPSRRKLFEDSYYGDVFHRPEYASSSFVSDDNYHYRVNNEIFNYLHDTYNNRKQSKWNKPIQKVIKKHPDNFFDVISINNTLGYIPIVTKNWESVVNNTLQEISRTLKSGGIFISDPGNSFRLVNAGIADKFTEIFDGIYVKK
ncbi:hypothetical protein IJZ97_04635 [bacterium]|nr:hypothetical protein [bacterium]